MCLPFPGFFYAPFETWSQLRTRSFDPDDEDFRPLVWSFMYALHLSTALADTVRIVPHPLALLYHVSR